MAGPAGPRHPDHTPPVAPTADPTQATAGTRAAWLAGLAALLLLLGLKAFVLDGGGSPPAPGGAGGTSSPLATPPPPDPSYPALAPGVTFPPMPADQGSLATWTYARQRAATYMAWGTDKQAPPSTLAESLPDPAVHGCLNTSALGYLSCTRTCYLNVCDPAPPGGPSWFVGAYARYTVPLAPPDRGDTPLTPLVVVGGQPGDTPAMVAAGTEVWNDGVIARYEWTLFNFPQQQVNCHTGCPPLHGGDDVFVSVFNPTDYTTAYFFENLTTQRYTFLTQASAPLDEASAGAFILLGDTSLPLAPFAPFAFQGTTLYRASVDPDTQQTSVQASLLDTTSATPVSRPTITSPPPLCVEGASGGSILIRDDMAC